MHSITAADMITWLRQSTSTDPFKSVIIGTVKNSMQPMSHATESLTTWIGIPQLLGEKTKNVRLDQIRCAGAYRHS